jgi:GAF domain-containing protein
VATISGLEAVATLLAVVCEITGMRFAAVVQVTGGTWIARAVHDDACRRLSLGDDLAVVAALRFESLATDAPIIIEHASLDLHYRAHPVSSLFQIESFLSMPIVLGSKQNFGILCAFDSHPATISQPHIVSMLHAFCGVDFLAAR